MRSMALLPTSIGAGDEASLPLAMRLGWTVAQVGGRYRRVAWLGPGVSTKLPKYALAVSDERSELELAIQSEQALDALARRFHVDVATDQLTSMPDDLRTMPASDYLRQITQRVVNLAGAGGGSLYRDIAALDQLLWSWNEYIEDRLHGASLTLHAAYELGRCLGEIWWARDPLVSSDHNLAFLLGNKRADIIRQLLNRLAGAADPLTIGAVSGSVDAWRDWVMNDHTDGAHEVEEKLKEQTLLWHDLLLEGASLQQHLAPLPFRRGVAIMRQAATAFLLPLLLVVVAIVAVVAAILRAPGSSALVASLLGGAGLVGVIVASLYAAAQNAVLGSLKRIHSAFELESAQVGITRLPRSATSDKLKRSLPGPTNSMGDLL